MFNCPSEVIGVSRSADPALHILLGLVFLVCAGRVGWLFFLPYIHSRDKLQSWEPNTSDWIEIHHVLLHRIFTKGKTWRRWDAWVLWASAAPAVPGECLLLMSGLTRSLRGTRTLFWQNLLMLFSPRVDSRCAHWISCDQKKIEQWLVGWYPWNQE